MRFASKGRLEVVRFLSHKSSSFIFKATHFLAARLFSEWLKSPAAPKVLAALVFSEWLKSVAVDRLKCNHFERLWSVKLWSFTMICLRSADRLWSVKLYIVTGHAMMCLALWATEMEEWYMGVGIKWKRERATELWWKPVLVPYVGSYVIQNEAPANRGWGEAIALQQTAWLKLMSCWSTLTGYTLHPCPSCAAFGQCKARPRSTVCERWGWISAHSCHPRAPEIAPEYAWISLPFLLPF